MATNDPIPQQGEGAVWHVTYSHYALCCCTDGKHTTKDVRAMAEVADHLNALTREVEDQREVLRRVLSAIQSGELVLRDGLVNAASDRLVQLGDDLAALSRTRTAGGGE